jgi:hypothetical protein
VTNPAADYVQLAHDFGAAGAVNGAIHPASARQARIGRIHDGAGSQERDVALLQSDSPAKAVFPHHAIHYNLFCGQPPLWEVFIVNENVLKWGGVGIIGILAAVAVVLFVQRGAHLDLPGHFLKVRTAPLSDEYSLVAIDFRVSNASDYPAVVRNVLIYAEDKNGARLAGKTIADPDAKRLFDQLPILGQKYNSSLILQDKIPGHATWDRMIAATFEVPEAKLAERKRFVVSIEEIDGRVFEIAEN